MLCVRIALRYTRLHKTRCYIAFFTVSGDSITGGATKVNKAVYIKA